MYAMLNTAWSILPSPPSPALRLTSMYRPVPWMWLQPPSVDREVGVYLGSSGNLLMSYEGSPGLFLLP